MKDCIEAKLFGIGLESYTVGSYDFYLGYGAKKNKIVTLDTGHFHLTEVSRQGFGPASFYTGDHVAREPSDSLGQRPCGDLERRLARSGTRNHPLQGIGPCAYRLGLLRCDDQPYRGVRDRLPCDTEGLMQALLEPSATLQQYEAEGKYFQRLALQEEMKSLPWTAVWDMFCLQNDVPVGEDYIAEIEKYEAEVTSKR